jgi:hypothetical protein
MSRYNDECYSDVERGITSTEQRTPDDIPNTTKEKQASKRAQDKPDPSRETRFRGQAPWGKR